MWGRCSRRSMCVGYLYEATRRNQAVLGSTHAKQRESLSRSHRDQLRKPSISLEKESLTSNSTTIKQCTCRLKPFSSTEHCGHRISWPKQVVQKRYGMSTHVVGRLQTQCRLSANAYAPMACCNINNPIRLRQDGGKV